MWKTDPPRWVRGVILCPCFLIFARIFVVTYRHPVNRDRMAVNNHSQLNDLTDGPLLPDVGSFFFKCRPSTETKPTHF